MSEVAISIKFFFFFSHVQLLQAQAVAVYLCVMVVTIENTIHYMAGSAKRQRNQMQLYNWLPERET